MLPQIVYKYSVIQVVTKTLLHNLLKIYEANDS